MAAGAPKTRGEASFFSKWELDRLKRPKKKKMEENDIFWETNFTFQFSHDINMHGLLFFIFYFWKGGLLFFFLYNTLFVNLTMIQIKFPLVEMFCFQM